MKGRLYINDILISDGIDIPLKIISNEINDLNDKRSNRSHTVILQKTSYLNEESEIWQSVVKVDYERNGYWLIKNGEAKANKFTKEEVHLNIYFGALNLASALNDKKLNELEILIDGNRTVSWDWSNITTREAGEDMCFIFCNSQPNVEAEFFTQGGTSGTAHDPRRFLPVVKVAKILGAIEDETGVSITGDITTDELMDNLYIPLQDNKGDDTHIIEGRTIGTNWNDNAEEFPFIFDAPFGTEYSKPRRFNLRYDNVLQGAFINDYTPNIISSGNYTIDFRFSAFAQILLNGATAGQVVLRFMITRNWNQTIFPPPSTNVLYSKLHLITQSSGGIVDIAGSLDTFIASTDTINIVCSIQNQSTTPLLQDFICKIGILGGTLNRIKFTPSTFDYGGEFVIGQNLPDITCLDFIKVLIQKKGFILNYDEINEKFILNYYSRLYDNQSIADDWTDKYISHEVTDIYGILGQETTFDYSNDSEMSADYGSYIELTNRKILTKKVNLLKDNSSATLMQKHSLLEQDTPYLGVLSSKNWKKLKLRLLAVERETINSTWVYQTANPNTLPTAITTANMGWFTRLGKGNINLDYTNLINNFYEDYVDNLKDYRGIEAEFILSEIDVRRSQDVPIYCKQIGYCFVKEIQFTSNTQVSKVKIIKI